MAALKLLPRDTILLKPLGLPWWLRWYSVCLQYGRPRFDPRVGNILWRGKWQPIPVLLPGKSQGWRSLVGYSPWGRKESDTTERLHKRIYQRVYYANLHSETLREHGM